METKGRRGRIPSVLRKGSKKGGEDYDSVVGVGDGGPKKMVALLFQPFQGKKQCGKGKRLGCGTDVKKHCRSQGVTAL